MTLANNPSIAKGQQQCFHCSDVCNSTIIYFDEQSFCCNGCKTVYQILGDSDLKNYYSIESNPGLKPKAQIGDFEFLELPEVLAQIVQFENNEIYKIKLEVPQIHCSSCIYLLEQLHKLNENILSSRVNFQNRTLTLSIKKADGTFYEVFQLLHKLGYTPQIPSAEDKNEKKASQQLIIKIGIAGFCFGNIMLLSFPEYISGNSDIAPVFQTIFKYLILALIFPVLFYAAKDYYIAAYQHLKHKYLSVDIPIVLGISALTVRSIYEMFALGNPGYFDSLAGFIFFLLIGKWFQSRTYENLSFNKQFSSFFPLAVLKKSSKGYLPIRIKELAKGDIIKLRNGEILPVNAQLLEEEASFDYSFVTGESKTIVQQKEDKLYAGGKLKSPSALLMVTHEVNNSYLQELWNNSDSKNNSKLISIIDNISEKFTLAIILLAAVGFLYWNFTGGFSKGLEVFTSILIVACPCALALAAPFTFGNASWLLSKLDIYLKQSSILESFSKIDTVIFDKTGTLTEREQTHINYMGNVLDHSTIQSIKSIVSSSIHPLSKALSNFLIPEDNHLLKVQDYFETPGKGIKACINNHQYIIGSSSWLIENNIVLDAVQNNSRSLVFIAKNTKLLGYFEFSNTYRPQILDKVKALSNQYKVAIVSGDGNAEADYLRQALDKNVTLSFNQSPNNKGELIQKLKKEGACIMMLGDGVNDTLALKESNIGVAITEDTGNFTPNSDIIMHGNSITKLPNVLRYAQDCNRTLYCCLTISILYNLIGLGFAFTGLLSPFVAAILMPLSSITVVLIAIGLTNYFAHKRKIKA